MRPPPACAPTRLTAPPFPRPARHCPRARRPALLPNLSESASGFAFVKFKRGTEAHAAMEAMTECVPAALRRQPLRPRNALGRLSLRCLPLPLRTYPG